MKRIPATWWAVATIFILSALAQIGGTINGATLLTYTTGAYLILKLPNFTEDTHHG